jgi:methyl-accepting chemotaxis protein
MSTERWDDDRLDRLANTVESNTRAIENNARLIESNARVIQALANVAAEAREERQQILQLIAQQQERMVEIDERIARQQTNIEGLRTETVRMLDILLNQRDRGDNPTA